METPPAQYASIQHYSSNNPKVGSTSMSIFISQLFRLRYNTFIFPRANVLQSPHKVRFRVFDRGRVLVGLKIRMNEFDKSVKILCRYL